MKINKLFSALLRYIKHHGEELNWLLLEVSPSSTVIYADSKAHSFALHTRLNMSPNLHHSVKITNFYEVYKMNSSQFEAYVIKNGEELTTDTIKPLPSYPSGNGFIVSGGKVASFLDYIYKVKETDNAWADYLHLALLLGNDCSVLRSVYCNKISVIVQDKKIDLPCCPEEHNTAVDVFFLDMIRAVLSKPSKYTLGIEGQNLYLFNGTEAFSYMLKDTDPLDKYKSLSKFISMPKMSGKSSVYLERNLVKSFIDLMKNYNNKPREDKEVIGNRSIDFFTGSSKTLTAECPLGKLDFGTVTDDQPLNASFSAKRLQAVFSFIVDNSAFSGCYIDMSNKIDRHGGHTAYFASVACNEAVIRKAVLAPMIK